MRGLLFRATAVKSLAKSKKRELRLSSYVAKVFDRPATSLEQDYISGAFLYFLQIFLEEILYRIPLNTTAIYIFLHSVQIKKYTKKINAYILSTVSFVLYV